MPAPRRFIIRLMSLAALSLLPGCVSLTPYREAVAALPGDQLVEVDGRRVHVEVTGAGRPVVLLHGFAASTFSFQKLAPLLAEHHRVVAIDLNGFGFTERPARTEPYTPDGQVRMVLSVLDHLGVGQATVVGHSYGAALAMVLAADFPDRVDRLVLISPAAEFEKPPWYLRVAPGRLLAYGMVRALLSSPDRFRRTLGMAYHRKDLLTSEIAEAYRERLLIEGLGDAFRGFGAAMQAPGDSPCPSNAFRRPLWSSRVATTQWSGSSPAGASPKPCRRRTSSSSSSAATRRPRRSPKPWPRPSSITFRTPRLPFRRLEASPCLRISSAPAVGTQRHYRQHWKETVA
ncbi:MAG: alpha/beta hydrolase [Opitutaceae bacterium]